MINIEKDHFKDRTIETTLINEIKVGDYVYICLKAMQPYAETIDDLCFGKVIEVLTKHSHPRGLKCKVKNYLNPNLNNSIDNSVDITDEEHLIGHIQIGRVVYKTTNGVIHRKNIS